MAVKQPPVRIPAAVRQAGRPRGNMFFIGQLRQENTASQPAFAARPLSLWSIPFFSLLLGFAGVASATPQEDADPADSIQNGASEQLVNSPMLPAPDYSRRSDYELTRLGARWDSLSAPEREALLREVKLRMAQRKDADGVLMIRTQRRYGRLYSGGGRYLKIETKVVQVRPAEGGAEVRGGYGMGYEQRNSATPATPVDGPEEVASPPPVLRVSDP